MRSAAGAPRSERRLAADQLLLQHAFVLVEQGHGDRGPVGEAAVERAPPDARGLRDVVHGDVRRALGPEQSCGGLQDPGAVAGGVGSLHVDMVSGYRVASQVDTVSA
ncbi:hypothetical protein GCM10018965_067040 [Nonomuraea roseola]